MQPLLLFLEIILHFSFKQKKHGSERDMMQQISVHPCAL